MRALRTFAAAFMLAVAPAMVTAQTTPAPIRTPARVAVNYSCSDKRTRVIYDNRRDVAYLNYAAKRIVLTPASSAGKVYVSAKYALRWRVTPGGATLSSFDPTSGADLTTLATCAVIAPAPRSVAVNYSCSDKRTRVVYDDRRDVAYLDYAAKRILLTPVSSAGKLYVSAKYALRWRVAPDGATLTSFDPKTGADVTTLASCTVLKPR